MVKDRTAHTRIKRRNLTVKTEYGNYTSGYVQFGKRKRWKFVLKLSEYGKLYGIRIKHFKGSIL